MGGTFSHIFFAHGSTFHGSQEGGLVTGAAPSRRPASRMAGMFPLPPALYPVEASMLINSRRAYGLVTIVFHWAIAPLFIGQIVLGVVMLRLDDQRRAFELIQLHKSIGFLILALAVPRLLWRLANRAPALPENMSRPERSAAKLSHAALYGLMIALPITGWILVSVSTLGIVTLAFNTVVIPNLPLPASDVAETVWSWIHTALAFLAAGLVLLHICAALWHQFLRRDDLLKRIILPGREERVRPRR